MKTHCLFDIHLVYIYVLWKCVVEAVFMYNPRNILKYFGFGWSRKLLSRRYMMDILSVHKQEACAFCECVSWHLVHVSTVKGESWWWSVTFAQPLILINNLFFVESYMKCWKRMDCRLLYFQLLKVELM